MRAAKAATGSRFAIASPHHGATDAGLLMFERGGNAVDAALGAAAFLTVAYPHMCAVGGDLFAIVVRPDGHMECINASGAAPAGANAEALRSLGRGMPQVGPDTITVPGAVSGWQSLSSHGRLMLSDVLQPAVEAARVGVPVSTGLAQACAGCESVLRADPGLRAIFLVDDVPLGEGDLLVQHALADTLQDIAEHGSDAMYTGTTAARFVAGLRRVGAPIDAGDLERHEAEIVFPLSNSYRRWNVSSAPPNSQGFVLLQALATIECLGIEPDPLGPDAATIATVFEMCSAERDRYLGDARFVGFDFQALLDDAHITKLVDAIRGNEVDRAEPATPAGGDTVAVVTADQEGWMVSLIQSIFHSFGSGILEPDTGIILHNRGALFSLDERSPGLLVPGRRPPHTLMPVIVHDGNRVTAVTGTMGGRAQPQIQAQVLMRILDGGRELDEAVDEPRWIVGGQDEPSPRTPVLAESRAAAAIERLTAAGRNVTVLPDYSDEAGHFQAITISDEGFSAAADPRSDGAAAAL